MLKFTKGLFGILGVVAAALMAFFMVKMFWRYNNVVSMALANHGTMPADPKIFMWLAPAAALVAGLLLGIAMALPRRTARSIRNEALDGYSHTHPVTTGTTETVDTLDTRPATTRTTHVVDDQR